MTSTSTPATASRSNRVHRLAVAACFFMSGFSFASWASRIPFIQQRLGLSDAGFGLVLFALPTGLFISLPISGWLVTHKGSRIVATCAIFVYTCILVTLGLAAHPWQLALALFCFGLIGNMGNISMNTQAVGTESLYGRNIMASFHGVWSVAGFSGAAFGTFMSGLNVVPPYHFLIVLLLVTVILVFTSPNLLPADMKSGEKTPFFALPDKSLVNLGLIAFCSMLCEGAMFDWSGIYFKKVVMAKPALVSAGYTAFMSTMALSRFVADHFTRRYGFKRIIRASGIIITLGLVLAVALPQLYTAILGFLLVGVGVSSVVPLVYSAAGKSKKMSPGFALASVSSISFFGFLIGPPMIGMLAGLSSLRLSFSVVACMGVCIILLSRTIKADA